MSQTTTLQQAKRLKELGFNERISYYYNSKSELKPSYYHSAEFHPESMCLPAPEINDALEWCMKEYGVWGEIDFDFDNLKWDYCIKSILHNCYLVGYYSYYPNFHEAQTACLNAVINECKKIKGI